MAEINILEDIKSNFEQITNLINSMRAQGILNFSGIDKVLNVINTRLSELDIAEHTDLIKVLISELKTNIEERHGFVATKFSEVEDSINTLLQTNKNQIKSEEIKSLFDVIATNLSVFSKEVVSQKDALTEITLRLEAMRVDDTNKNDIIKNISVLKFDLAKLNNGFESIILNINNNFNELSQSFEKLIQSNEQNSLAPAINDIHSTSNSILSAIEILDKKNTDLNAQLERFVTIGDFKDATSLLNAIAEKSDNIASVIANTADRDSINSVNSSLVASIDAIKELRTYVESNSQDNHSNIIGKLDQLEQTLKASIDNIDLNQIRTEILNIVNQIGQETNIICSDLLETNTGLKQMLSDLDIADLGNSVNSFYEALADSQSTTRSEMEQVRKLVEEKTNVQTNVILEQFTSSIDNIGMSLSALGNEVKTTAIENKSDILIKIDSLAQQLQQINLTPINNGSLDIDNLNQAVDDLKSIIANDTDILNTKLELSSEKFIEKLDNLTTSTNNIKSEMLFSAENNVEKITSQITSLNYGIENLKSYIESSNPEQTIDNITDKISTIETLLGSLTEDLKQQVELAKNSDKTPLFEEYFAKLDALSDDFKSIYLSTSEDSKENINRIYESIAVINRQVPEIIQNSRTAIQESIATLETKFENTNEKFNDFLNRFDANEMQSMTIDRIDTINSDIKFAITALSGNIDENHNYLNQKISEIDNDIKTISGTIFENISSNQAEVNNRLNSIIDSILEIKQAENYINEAQIREITDRIATVSSDIKDLLRNNIPDSKDNKEFGLEKLDAISKNLYELKDVIASSISSSNLDIADKIIVAKEEINSYFNDMNESVLNSNNQVGQQIQEMTNDVKNVTDKLANYFIKNDTDVVERLSNLSYNVSIGQQQLNEKCTSIETDLQQVKTNFEEKSNTIIDSLDSFNVFLGEKSSFVAEKLAGLDTCIKSASDSISEIITSENNELCGNITSRMDAVNERIQQVTYEIIEKLSQTIEDKTSLIATTKDCLEIFKSELEEKLNLENEQKAEYQQKIFGSIDEIQAKLFELFSNNSTVINNLSNDINSTKVEIIDTLNLNNHNIQEAINANSASIKAELENNFNKISDIFVTTSEQTLSEITTKIETNITRVSEELIDKNSYSNDILLDTIKTSSCEMIESMAILRGMVSDVNSGFGAHISEMLKQTNESLLLFQNNLTLNSDNKLEEIKQEFRNVTDEVRKMLICFESLNSAISQAKEDNNLTINAKCAVIIEMLNNFENIAQNTSDDIHSNINGKFEELKSIINEINDSNKESYSSNLGNLYISIQQLKDEIAKYSPSLDTGKFDEISDKIEEKITQNKIDTQSYLDTIIGLLNKLFDNSSSNSDLDEVLVSINSTKDQLISVMSSELKSNNSEIINELSLCITESKEELKDIINNYKYALDTDLNELKDKASNTNDNVVYLQDKLEDIKNHISTSTNKDDLFEKLYGIESLINGLYDNSKDEIKNKLDDLQNSIAQVDNTNIIDERFNDLSGRLNYDISELKASAQEKLDDIKNCITTSNNKDDIFEKLYGIESLINGLYDNSKDEIKDKLDDLQNSIAQVDNTSIIDERFNDLSGRLNYDISELKVSAQEKLEDIKNCIATSNNKDELFEKLYGIESLINGLYDNSKDEIINKLDDLQNSIEQADNTSILDERLNNFNSRLSYDISELKVSAQEKLDDIRNHITTLNNKDELFEKLYGIESLINGLYDNSKDEIKNKLDDLQNSIEQTDNTSIINERLNILDNKLDNNISNLKSVTQENLDEIRNTINVLNNKDFFNDKLNELEELVGGLYQKDESRYLEQFEDLKNNIENFNSDIKSIIYSNNENLPQVVISIVEEKINNALNTLISEINSINNFEKLEIIQTNLNNLEAIIANSKSELLNETTDKLDTTNLNIEKLQYNLDEIKSKLEQVNSKEINLDEIIEELSVMNNKIDSQMGVVSNIVNENISRFDDEFDKLTCSLQDTQESVDRIRTTSEQNVVNIVESISGKINNLQTEFSAIADMNISKITGSLNTIESLIKTLDENIDEDTTHQLSIIKEELSGVLNTLFASNDSLSNNIDKQFSNFTNKLESLMQDVTESLDSVDSKVKDSILEEIGAMRTDCANLNAIFEQNKEITSYFEGVKSDINSKYNGLLNAIEDNSANINVELALAKIDNLNNKIVSNEDWKEEVQGIKDLLDEQASLIKNLSFENDFEAVKATAHENVERISSLINDKVANVINKDDFYNEIQKLKNEIAEQNLTLLDNVSFDAEQNEIISVISRVSDEAISLIDNSRSEIISELERSSDSLRILVEDSKSELVSEFDNIYKKLDEITDRTFEDGFESIKESVNKSTDRIDETIQKRFENLSYRINGVAEKDELHKEFDEVKKHLLTIQSGEDDAQYIYSLQDVESDIAKLRIAMKELQDITPDKEIFAINNQVSDISESLDNIKTQLSEAELYELSGLINRMTDDVVSISTRTNKLILTSENSANMLKDNIADFRLVINDIDERTRELTAQTDLSSIHSNLEDLNKFVYNIQNSVENNTEYNKVVNESLLAIAEWVDNAGATLSSLDAKIEKIDNIEEVKKLIKNIEKPAEFDYSIIQTLDSKLNQQQERIDSLESKLDRILELVEANDCAPITKKLGGVDRQLAKLNKSIERLTAYVNEE